MCNRHSDETNRHHHDIVMTTHEIERNAECGQTPAEGGVRITDGSGGHMAIPRRNVFVQLLGAALGLSAARRAAAASPVCDFCHEEIDGRYFIYKSNRTRVTICASCDQKYPKCEACRLPQQPGDIILQRGERLCRECAASAKYCSICQKRIEGRYYQFTEKDGKGQPSLYCATCYAHAPKCVVCNRPTPRERLDAASGACLDCLKDLPVCKACGVAIVGRYYEFEHTDGKYCENCKRNRPACYTCGVPVGKNYWKFDDGRSICEDCHARAIFDKDQIVKIMDEVEQLLQRRYNMVLKTRFQLSVQPLNSTSLTQARKAKEGLSDASPLVGAELGLYRNVNGQAEIFLLYGLPREMIYETAAHEYAHAWHYEQDCPFDQSLDIKEGFAQWAAAKILEIKGFKQALEKLEDRRDRYYGTGYQRFKAVEKKLGVRGVFDYLTKQKR
ncbi:MAG: hypothetical protein GC154_18315 [bacterium]|nr:hypothetical protein [bacterium]